MKRMIEKAIEYHKQKKLYRMVKRKTVNIFRPSIIFLMRMFPISNTKVCFDSFEGTGFCGDPQSICIELHRIRPDLRIIWFVREKKNNFPSYIRQVNIDSIEAIYQQGTSKVWVDNTRTGHRTKKRSGQKYLQTWHGNLLGKKVEKDAEDKLWPEYISVAKYDGKITDAFIVANLQSLNLAKKSFWLNENVEYLKIGAPSMDVLFAKKDDEDFKHSIRTKIGIVDSTYVVLYAPSFRDDESTDGYKLDFQKLIRAFEQNVHRKCVFLVRFHPDVVQHDMLFKFSDNMINVTRYSEANDLSLVADCLITDYSSIAYDFLILRKPIFRICLDFDKYRRLRDVYNEFYSLPYGIYTSNSEAIKAIKEFDQKEYQRKLNDYFEKNPVYDNGTASKKAVEWICKQLK